jgi:hyperosmotically inducible periplasmic protein
MLVENPKEACMKTRFIQATRAVGLAVLLATTVVACGKSVGETVDDATITTKVKSAFLNDAEVGGLRIDVDTFKSIVTLSGRVKSQAEADKAIALARRTDGVKDVKSTLQVIPST